MKKLLVFSALFILACSADYEIVCIDEQNLLTFPATNITRTSATLNGAIVITPLNCDTPSPTSQGFVYSTSPEPTLEDFIVNSNAGSVNLTIDNLEPNTAYYFRTFVINNAANIFDKNEEVKRFMTHADDEPTNCEGVYLRENGVTIKACEFANVGEVGSIDGIEYTVVSELSLRQMIENNVDISSVCTSRVTSMEDLFYQNSLFSQDISSWDVSNVTNMSKMFEESTFNQDISNWDVRNLTNAYAMFKDNSVFNQPLENWNVGNVSKMGRMFEGNSAFNQPINNWNTSNVAEMWYMFLNASNFNQNTEDWDVSNVLECNSFSSNTPQWTLPQPNFTNCRPF
jgi:surface protein